MRITHLRRANTTLSDYLRKNIKLGTIHVSKYLNEAELDRRKSAVVNKIQSINNWYTRIIGLDEVKLYQDRVAALQERLLIAQDKRRNISQHLAEIRKKSNDLQEQIHKVKRQENLQHFLDLMKEETEVLKLEEEVSHAFQECDREEREIFTAFTNAVRDSHEKQRAQLEYTKYFGIILSIVGSLLTFVYSTVKKHDLKRCIEENIAKVANITPQTIAAGAMDISELNNLISQSSTPVLKSIEASEKEIKEIRNILADRRHLNEIAEEIKKGQKEIGDIKKLMFLVSSVNVGKNSEQTKNDIRDAYIKPQNESSEFRQIISATPNQIILYGLAVIGVFSIAKGFFG